MLILAVNIYMYGTVNVHEFIYSSHGALIRMGAFIRMRALIGIGALIDENTFEGGRLFGRGHLLEGGR